MKFTTTRLAVLLFALLSMFSVSAAQTSTTTTPTCTTTAGVTMCVAVAAPATGAGVIPTGQITWTSTDATGYFASTTCTLSGGSCGEQYTQTDTNPAVVIASYGGDSNYGGSLGYYYYGLASGTSTTASTVTTASCATPSSGSTSITCTATVTVAGSGTVPAGDRVQWSTTDITGGSFDSQTCSLTASGSCFVHYTQTDTNPSIVFATYEGDSSLQPSFGDYMLSFGTSAPSTTTSTTTSILGSTPPCARTGTCITSYAEFQQWLPIAMLAILVSISAVALYYLLALFLNNKGMKSRAVNELGQAIGTGIMVVVIIALFTFFGGGIFSQVPAVSPVALNTVCGQLGGSQGQSGISGLQFLQPGPPYIASGSPSGVGFFGTETPSPTNTICNEINNIKVQEGSGSAPSITDNIDYGLFSIYIIAANVTNQEVNNYNGLYFFEAWIRFASSFTSVTQICGDPLTLCALPIGPREYNVRFSYEPLAGDDAIHVITQTIEQQSAASFYALYLQLIFLILTLYLWPWLLAAGVILRASFFTRRLGGLVIGLTFALLLVWPTVYIFEYSTFYNQASGLGLIGAGASTIGILPIYETNTVTGKTIVYGTPTPQSGYVLSAGIGGCPNSDQFVFENKCGDITSIQPGACLASDQLTSATQLCPGGYVRADWTPTADCPLQEGVCAPASTSSGPSSSSYVCTDPSGTETGSCSCSSGVTICPCEPYNYLYENVCGYPGTISSSATCIQEGTAFAEPPAPSLQAPECVQNGDGSPQPGPLEVNFFVLPNVEQMLNYYNCGPGNLFWDEGTFTSWYMFPFAGVSAELYSVVGGLAGSTPTTPADQGWLPTFHCTISGTIGSAVSLAGVYGFTAVSAYLIPLINLVVVLSTAIGISGLLGGDTNLLGLGKLL